MTVDLQCEPASMPLISVIVPVYNGQDTVGQTISSVLRQTYPNLELLVVDDGSSDGTPRILEAYQGVSRPGREIRTLRQENAGCGSARNRGIAEAHGGFVIFCDADDFLLPPFVERLMEERTKNPSAKEILYSNGYQMTPAGIRPDRPVYREKMPPAHRQRRVILEYNIGLFTGLFPRSFFEEVGVFDVDQVYVEDWELWLRAVYSGWCFRRLEENYWVSTWTPGSMMSNRERMADGERTALEKTIARFRSSMTPEELLFAERRLAVGSPIGFSSEAEQALREGRLRDARRYLRMAAQMMPTQRRVTAKAAISRVPGGMRLLRRRQRTVDGYVDYNDSMRR
ncbi:glycosyltransferase family 2 protein [Kocuria arenosa]|uniref:glycosyltransferase family 2 protein n=1 Tax=Kocuria arenosa TaxID=3071446 RepID=UPI0034D6B698